MSAKWGLCTSPRPCPPAQRPSCVRTPSGFPRACLTNPRVFTFAHDLRWICLLSIFSTHCPSERWPLRPPSDFRLPELEPGHAFAPEPCSGALRLLWVGHFLSSLGEPSGEPSSCPQHRSQDCTLSWPTGAACARGCSLDGSLTARNHACSSLQTHCPAQGSHPAGHPETAVSGHPTQTSVHLPALPTAGFHPSPSSGGFSLFLPVFTGNLSLF